MTTSIDTQIKAFDDAHSSAGRFDSYASHRLSEAPYRQVLLGLVAVCVALFGTPVQALFVAGVVLLGEALDCGLLFVQQRAREKGMSLDAIRGGAIVLAMLQSAAVVCAVGVTYAAVQEASTLVVVFALLAAAGVNAAQAVPYFSAAAYARLAVLGIGAAGLLAMDILRWNGAAERMIAEPLALGLFCFVVWSFARRHAIATRARWKAERAALLDQRDKAKTAARLSAQQKELRMMANVAQHANDSIIVTDAARRILWVNQGFTNVSGFSRSDAVGRRIGDLLNGPSTDLDAMTFLEGEVQSGRAVRTQIANRRRDGAEVWIDVNAVPVLDDAGSVDMIISVERDITEARTNAVALEDARKRAEAAERAKANFLANMSHEMRTPLNAILGMSELLDDENLKVPASDYVGTVRASAEGLLRIVDDILDYSQAESRDLLIEEKPFSLSTCIRSVVDLLQPLARKKRLFLDVTFETQMPEQVLGDEARLRQVLVNLVDNGIKFTETGGVALTVDVSQRAGTAQISILIRDTGPGVAPEVRERIFQGFEQGSTGLARDHNGTGLGLPLSRELLRMMKGDIAVVDHPKGGGAFQVTLNLPVVKSSSPATAPDLSPKDIALAVQDLVVLVADDNAVNRRLIEAFLQETGVHLHIATGGAEAVATALEMLPDVILMDLSMPGLSGLEATEQIRASLGNGPRIIAITASLNGQTKADCLRAGMNDFLTKPVRKSVLLQCLARHAVSEKPLGQELSDGVSPRNTSKEGAPWISQPESGTINGKSTRSSAR